MKADIYHIHDPELLVIIPILKLLSGSKIIYDCHEDYIGFMLQKQHIPAFFRKGFSKLMEFLEYYTTHFLDAVITADPGVEKKFKDVRAKTLTLYNFPRLDYFSLPAVTEKEYDLVYHGSIPRYHMEVCFAIDKALLEKKREVNWFFIGTYGDKIWAEQVIVARSAEHRFTLYERIPHNKIANEVKKARIGIIPLPDLPKFQHNIPTKLFEFMALEMPVVMSDLPPSQPFLGDGKCGIMVPPHDYDAYAEAIIKLLDEPDLRIRMGKAGRLKVEAEYNWNKEAEKLVNLYSSFT
jgi:glycosyltransferase involved in cell wall biosynthesis